MMGRVRNRGTEIGTRVGIVCVALSLASGALAQGADDDAPDWQKQIEPVLKRNVGCVPKDNTARVLKSANPNDLVPNWTGTNALGTAWTFAPKRYVKTEIGGGIFLQGDLYSPRGGLTDKNVFVLFKEWDCSEPR